MSTKSKANADAATALALQSFQNEIVKLKQTATDWYGNEYATSNERLYSIFSSIYTMYEQLSIAGNSNTQKRKWIQREIERKGVTLTKKPTIVQLLTVYSFYVDGVEYAKQQKRISAYVRVLTSAIENKEVYADNIAEWISKEGGVENIRIKATKSAVSKSDRSVEGKKLLMQSAQIATVSTEKSKSYAAHKSNDVVLLVGVLQKDGTIAVQHEIYAEEYKSNIKGNTAINTALANVFSKYNETQNKTKKQVDAESEAAKSTKSVAQYIEDERCTEPSDSTTALAA
jgi:hypothetical protein